MDTPKHHGILHSESCVWNLRYGIGISQGRFAKLKFTEAQARNWKIHLAEEQGITLNPEDINITPEDLVEYRINGTGANIYTYGCK